MVVVVDFFGVLLFLLPFLSVDRVVDISIQRSTHCHNTNLGQWTWEKRAAWVLFYGQFMEQGGVNKTAPNHYLIVVSHSLSLFLLCLPFLSLSGHWQCLLSIKTTTSRKIDSIMVEHTSHVSTRACTASTRSRVPPESIGSRDEGQKGCRGELLLAINCGLFRFDFVFGLFIKIVRTSLLFPLDFILLPR